VDVTWHNCLNDFVINRTILHLLFLCLQPRLGDPATSGGGLILSTILVAWGTAAVLGGKGLLKSNK
jgi:hypothetical protein